MGLFEFVLNSLGSTFIIIAWLNFHDFQLVLMYLI